MFRRALIACLAVCACARPAMAQTRIYVSGDLFAEVTRFPVQSSVPDIALTDTTPPNGVTWGGGGRIGAFFSPEWSLELGVDLDKEIGETKAVSVNVAGFPTTPPPQYQSHTSGQFVATSVLIGYHPAAGGRVHAGFRGGLSVMRTHTMFTSPMLTVTTVPPVILPLTSVPSAPLVVTSPTITVTTSEITNIGYGMFATLAGEVAIDVSSHVAAVPEVRAHMNLSTLLFRPGVAVRWRW